MTNTIKIAGVQMDVALADKQANLQRMVDRLEETAGEGAKLTIFPECSLTGYCFESLAEALPHGEPAEGGSCQALVEACRRLGVLAVYGFLERDGDSLYNACSLVGPGGLAATYRKVHLPHLGVDMFTTPGQQPFAAHDAPAVNDTPAFRLGMNICYDAAFPEAARLLALDGADLIILPTNWPPGAECTAAYAINARAMENHVFYIAVNRVGTESGFPFIGGSKICDPHGNTIAEAAHTDETILYAEIEPALARNKRLVRVKKKHHIHRFDDRRPEMYGPLTAPNR